MRIPDAGRVEQYDALGVSDVILPVTCRLVPYWQGRKSDKLIRRVLRIADGPKARLLDLFGGSGSACASAVAPNRWWNDLDGTLATLALDIRDRPADLTERCRNLPIGDTDAGVRLWDDMRAGDRADWLPETLAWAAGFTFGARMRGKVYTSHGRSSRAWVRWVDALERTSGAFRTVRVTRLHWEDCLEEAPEEWFVYADPPYYETHANGYAADCQSIDWDRMLRVLARRPALVSGYLEGTPWTDEWMVYRVPTLPGRAARRKATGEVFRTEVIAANRLTMDIVDRRFLEWSTIRVK